MFEPSRNEFIPLYHQLRLWIEERIKGGEFPPGSLLPSERELCERFKVSNITARRALNELVRGGLVYRQSGVGTFVANSTKHLRLALVTYRFGESWWRRRGASFSALIGGIARVTWECDAQFSMLHLGSDGDMERFIRNVVDEKSFDGILIRPAVTIAVRHIEALEQRHLPYVLVRNRPQDRVANCVRFADEEEVYQATHHLVELGHTRIAYAAGHRDYPVFAHRLRGYFRALEEAGIPQDPTILREEHDLETGDPIGREMISELLHVEPRPTALVVATSPLVPWAYRAVQEDGLCVGTDISIVGADEEMLGADMTPVLSRFGRSHFELGLQATKLLIDLIEKGSGSPVDLVLPPSFELGCSTAPVP